MTVDWEVGLFLASFPIDHDSPGAATHYDSVDIQVLWNPSLWGDLFDWHHHLDCYKLTERPQNVGLS